MKEDNRPTAILCPNCGKLVNRNTHECIHCGYKNPGKLKAGSLIQILFQRDVGFIEIATLFCIALYIFSILLEPSSVLRSSGIFNFLPPGGRVLDKLGMTGSFAMAEGRWWTLITAIYLHGGLLHILFNVLWIRQLGPVVEELFGTSRLILIFTLSGVFGFIVSNFVGVYFTIGASGSIFGLLGALIFYGRDRGGVFGEAMFRQLMVWAIILFVLGFTMSGVNNFAHGGGFVGGYLSAMLVKYNEKKVEAPSHKTAAAAMVIITVISFLLAFWYGFID